MLDRTKGDGPELGGPGRKRREGTEKKKGEQEMGRAKREEGNEKKKESPMNYKQAIQFKFKFKKIKFKLNSNNETVQAA